MKRKLLSTALALSLFSLHSFSQEISFRSAREKNMGKSALFTYVAERVAADPAIMQNLFAAQMGESMTVKFSDNLQLNGRVMMTEQETNFQSITLRCTNFPGALFTLSKVTDADGSINYVGAIISNNHKDMISLEKDSNGNYAWVKKNLSEILPD